MKKIFFLTVFLLALCPVISGCAGNNAILSALPVASGDETQPEVQDASLQEIIDRTADGDKILIKSGTYTILEPLRVEGKKELYIKGEGNIVILGENIDKQIIIIKDCENIRLENIRARHKSSEGSPEKKVFEKRDGSVIDVEDTGRVELINCELEGCGVYGLYAVDTGEIDITGCYIHHNSWMAMGLHAQRKAMRVDINDCTITNNADFVEKEGSVNINLYGQNDIKSNNIEGYKNR